MKIFNLLNQDKHTQLERIKTNTTIILKDAVENPQQVSGKIVCIIGNYAGFDTTGLVIRKFCFNANEKKWIISDLDMSDGFEEFYVHHFTQHEVLEQFSTLLDVSGYLLAN